jgi:N-acetylglucosamine-6-sulfatase
MCNALRLAILGLVVAVAPKATCAEPPPRPNIVFILVDDLRFDDIACAGHPFVKTPHIDRIAREGVRFTSAFATTPLCSPSRACFLTGQYAHTHGIIDNTDRAARSHELVTFPRLLDDAGYETAYVGKWHMGVDDQPRPGFDYWLSVKGQGAYIDPEVNENGERKKLTGYVTDLFNDKSVSFIKRPHEKPFLLYLAHKAVHPSLVQRPDGTISDPNAATFVPAERHRDLYADARIQRRPNAADDLAGKPALRRKIEGLPPLGPQTGTGDDVIRNRLRMLAAVDDGVGQILKALEESKQLDRTLVIFTSDHGYFYGEHGLSVERRLAYEETIRIPLLMRYPPLIKAGTTVDAFALSVDLAPSLLELGGAPVPKNLHGRSLLPWLRGDKPAWRQSFLIEHFSDNVFPRARLMGYQAVRTERWKYIHYTDLADMDELYDLQADPYELKNRIADPAVRKNLATLKADLERLRRETP